MSESVKPWSVPDWFAPGRFWLTRLYLAVDVGTELSISLLHADSPNGLAMRSTGSLGLWVCGVLAVMSVMLTLDSIINDLMPRRHKCKMLLRTRTWLLVFLAFGQLGMGAAMSTVADHWWDFALRFWGPAGFLMCLAFADTYARGVYRDK